MKQTKERYIELDLIRVVCCIAVLLYHLGILAGGFFAVCAFFVLSGYLGVRSAFGQERFNILRYWVKRIWRVYVPLLAVALITVGVVTLLPQISWLNLKPETTSVLLGYNNFWQISASQDYFARHGDSPFIHFWFIAILLQFELVFPLVFVVLKFIGKKISRVLACILPLAVCAASFLFFYQLLGEGRMTEAYYHSMARAFAPFLGVAVGFIEEYAGPIVPKPFRKGAARGMILLLYLAAFVYLNIAFDSSFKCLAWAFLAVTVISARLACYACVRTKTAHGKPSGSSALAFIADSSYEIYLVQYPFIFIFTELFSERMGASALTVLIVAATLAAAFLMHFGFSYRKGKKPAGLKIAMLAAVLLLTAAGGYCFSVAKDHTQEMAELEQKLEENAREMEARQKAMAEQSRNEEDKWAETLASFDGGEEKVLQAVREMRVICIGDSVMLGALDGLADTFPNGWFDAQKSRTAWVLPGIVRDLKNKGMLGDVVVICFGANGDCPIEVKERAMNMLEGRRVYWLTNTNPRTAGSNESLKTLAEEYDNLTILDWKSISKGHPEYFYADGIHLSAEGRRAYCDAVLSAVSEPYLNEWRANKAAAEAQYEAYRSRMVSFFGNDLLTNVYPLIEEDYPYGSFKTYEQFDVGQLMADIRSAAGSMTLADKIVLLLDSADEAQQGELKQLAELCGERKLFLVTPGRTAEVAPDGSLESVKTWAPESGRMFMADGEHLSSEANEALRSVLLSLELDRTK